MAENFFDLLHQEHEKVKGILEQLRKTPVSSVQMRHDLFEELQSNLTLHMKGEEKYFYPVLERKNDSKQDALEAEEEHHATKLILGELDGMPKQMEVWGAKLSVLKYMVEHHVQEEESRLFEAARKNLSQEQLQSIMQSYQADKKKGSAY